MDSRRAVERTLVLRPDPPVRSLAIAGATVLAGAVLLVWSTDAGWPVGVTVLGVVAMVLGAVLAVAALLVHRRLSTTLTLGAEAYTIRRSGVTDTHRWADVAEVGRDPGGLVFRTRAGGRHLLVIPSGRRSAELDDISAEVAARLDDDRGYRPLEEVLAEPEPPADPAPSD